MTKAKFREGTSYFMDSDVKIRFEREEVVDALLSFYQGDDLMILVRKSDEFAPVVVYQKNVEILQEDGAITDITIL